MTTSTDRTNADLVADIVGAELAINARETELEWLRDIEVLARELVLALRAQGLVNPITLTVSGCAATCGLERVFDDYNDDEPDRVRRLKED